jgi:hypothetical protein
MWPDHWQRQVIASHPDLYRRHEQDFARLHVPDGHLQLGSVNSAPFGLLPLFDPGEFEPIVMPD